MNANAVRFRFSPWLLAGCCALASPMASAAWGELDASFGGGGAAFADFPGHTSSYVYATAVDASGNVYLAGDTYSASTYWNFAVTKFDALGNPDASFGVNGRVELDLGNVDDDYAYAITVAPSGAIFVGGEGVAPFTYDMVVAKLDVHGALVAGFGSGGVARVAVPNANGVVEAIELDAAGNIYAGGFNSRDGTIDYAVAKLNASGALVTDFGSGGLATVDLGGGVDYARDVLVDPAGNIFLGGDGNVGGSYQFAVVKLGANGQPASGFGTNGKAIHPGGAGSDDYGYALARDAAGNIYLGGGSNAAGTQAFAMQKLDAQGNLVAGFGINGLKLIEPGTGSTGIAHAIAIDAAGHVLLAGKRSTGTHYALAVGALDAGTGNTLNAFGGGGSGFAYFDFNNTLADAFGLAIDASGRIVAGCHAYQNSAMHFGAARLQGAGLADRIFANSFELPSGLDSP